jgi:hypothetical protein
MPVNFDSPEAYNAGYLIIKSEDSSKRSPSFRLPPLPELVALFNSSGRLQCNGRLSCSQTIPCGG